MFEDEISPTSTTTWCSTTGVLFVERLLSGDRADSLKGDAVVKVTSCSRCWFGNWACWFERTCRTPTATSRPVETGHDWGEGHHVRRRHRRLFADWSLNRAFGMLRDFGDPGAAAATARRDDRDDARLVLLVRLSQLNRPDARWQVNGLDMRRTVHGAPGGSMKSYRRSSRDGTAVALVRRDDD